jgi:dTDP-4-dehydrorhamnose reductase
MLEAFSDRDLIPLTRVELDITEPARVRDAIAELSPSAIINCAAFNDVDGAEDEVQAAFAVNAFGVRSLAFAAERTGATLFHFSTDFVFDGCTSKPYRESDRPSPKSIYAESKLLGEWFALSAPRAFVLRVESLFGCSRDWSRRRGTLDSLVARMEAGETVPVFTDRVVSPSRLSDVATATRHLLDTDAESGLYHCVNAGRATWREVAEEVARQLDLTPRLTPITVDQVTLRAERPVFCALDNAKLTEAGFEMPSWSDAVTQWLAAR